MTSTSFGSVAGACAGASLLALAACGNTVAPPDTTTLDRPSSIAFSCFGTLRLTGGGPSSPGDEVVVSPMPAAACTQWAEATLMDTSNPGAGFMDTPEGQEGLSSQPTLVGFIVQQATGTLAVMQSPLTTHPLTAQVTDADPLTPGENAIPIGTLPVGVTVDPSGCHAVVANAGSCDLSLLDVAAALDRTRQPAVQRLPVLNTAGARIGGRPAAIAGQIADAPVGVECQPTPDSVVYVAYPDCNLVAAVNAGTGQTLAGVVFRDDGTVEITTDVTGCDATCGAVTPVSVDAGAPVALHTQADGQRLYIGSDNRAEIVAVDLDEAGLPAAVTVIPLEGDVGITSLAASDVVGMGGSGGMIVDGGGGAHRFVYAVATDGTIRVADVLDKLHECDTQVDPRFLYDSTDVTLLSCVPIEPLLHPRRFGARSPGIHIPDNGVPLDVALVTVDGGSVTSSPAPADMIGTFAFATLSSGRIAVINVDDDNMRDFENTGDPAETDLVLAMAHQVRDRVSARDAVADPSNAPCQFPTPDALQLGPRISTPPLQTIQEGVLAPEKIHLAPIGRSLLCSQDVLTAGGDTPDDPDDDVFESEPVGPVSDLSFMTPPTLRDQVFPDLFSVNNQETWTFTWEGRISNDTRVASTRRGVVTTGSAGTLALRDDGGPFCKMGVEAFDSVRLLGCDPAGGQCGLGETCFVHPDTPASISTGICLPAGQAQLLSETCRDLFISRRRFSIREVYRDRLVFGARRRVLRTTPLDGCTSSDQCVELYDAERALGLPQDPDDLQLDPEPYTWSCESDTTRAPGPDRCVMTCGVSDDCEGGFQCSGGYCVEARVPPAECFKSIQRYEVRVSDAFSVIGNVTGFLHDRITDPATGACVADPDAHPLAVGRLPLTAPACVSDERTALTPNPCLTTVEHAELVPNFDTATGAPCDLIESEPLLNRTRSATALRFQNPAFVFHLVDPVTTGDAVCNGDAAGTGPAIPIVFPDYQVAFSLIGGFDPFRTALIRVGMRYPHRIIAGPLGDLWIMDEGDLAFTVRGQVLVIAPEQAREGFFPVAIR